MSPQKSRVLADNVHDVRCDDSFVVFALKNNKNFKNILDKKKLVK